MHIGSKSASGSRTKAREGLNVEDYCTWGHDLKKWYRKGGNLKMPHRAKLLVKGLRKFQLEEQFLNWNSETAVEVKRSRSWPVQGAVRWSEIHRAKIHSIEWGSNLYRKRTRSSAFSQRRAGWCEQWIEARVVCTLKPCWSSCASECWSAERAGRVCVNWRHY